jgi:two-component system sensor histidine kinase UhpB
LTTRNEFSGYNSFIDYGAIMQLVTRLLLRLSLVGLLMLMLAFALTLFSARQDIADEIQGSQRVGQLTTVLSELQDGASLDQHALRIDELNRSETLRHFHVALLDSQGQRLTQIANPLPPSSLPWLNRFMAGDVVLSAYTLPVRRPNGEHVTVMLEPNPQPEITEAINSAWLQVALFSLLVLVLVMALAFSVRHALSPLNEILNGIARIEGGDYAHPITACATRELNQIGQALNHLSAALTEQLAKQRDLLHRLQDVQEDERRQLAHDLHDEFGQLLTAIQVDASYLVKQSHGQSALQDCARAMYDNSSSILSQLKSLLVQLRPYGLQGDEEHHIALEQALRELIRQRQARADTELSYQLHIDLKDVELPQRLSVAAYRIIQEALTNVLRHAQATLVVMDVWIDTHDQLLLLRIADNGKGLPPTGSSNSPVKGLGLVGIKERVLANGGGLTMGRAEPQGLEIKVSFPLC